MGKVIRTTPARLVSAAAVACLFVASQPARADEVLLRSGGKVSGVIVERTASKIVIESGPGRVTLPMSRVLKVVESRSAIEAWQEKAADLAAGDVEGWATLARWAAERDLGTQSRDAWRRVLALQPAHAEANAALGRERLDGEWLDRDDAYRARGFVMFEGRWLTPVEHEAALREREAESWGARERRESEARVREAEARAREAEARAHEAERQPAEVETGGIPYGWGWGGGGYWPMPPVDPGPDLPPPSRPPHHVSPPRSTPPSSINGPSDTKPADAKHEGVSRPSPRS
jgi:hypothetical protein